jgi:hypothetical protein
LAAENRALMTVYVIVIHAASGSAADNEFDMASLTLNDKSQTIDTNHTPVCRVLVARQQK